MAPGAPNTARGGYYDLGPGLKGDPVPESFGDTPSLDETLASISQALDNAFGTTRGGILYRGAATWLLLPPSTSGFSLETLGAGADPAWASISTLLDTLGNTQGLVLYRSASGWTVLAPGTSGFFLKTLGAGANPAWAAISAGDVVGPGVAVDLDFVQFDGTTGKLIKDGGLSRDTDGTMAANSDSRIPSQKAVVTYVAAHGATFANPSATASDVAVNGAAGTAMRSDAAPAVQKGTNAVFGLAKGDGTTITLVAGVASLVSGAAAPPGNAANEYFGDGADGDLTIASGITTLTRDMFYRNLTINGTGQLNTNTFRVFVSGTLDISAAPAGAITCLASAAASKNGGNANNLGNGGSGTGPATTHTVGSSSSATVGANGGTGAGAQAGALSHNTSGCGDIPSASGTSGAGGTGSGGAGGATRAGVVGVTLNDVRWLTRELYVSLNNVFGFMFGGIGGPGGGSGGGDGVANGGGGGCGGMGGPVVWIAAAIINRGASTAVAALNADGGNGGNGGTVAGTNNGGGGGGSGGSGGWLYLIYSTLIGSSGTNILSAQGGNGGTGGNGHGTGLGGNGGAGASRGRIDVYCLATGVHTNAAPDTTTVTGTAHVGTAGGAGGTANTQALSL